MDKLLKEMQEKDGIMRKMGENPWKREECQLQKESGIRYQD